MSILRGSAAVARALLPIALAGVCAPSISAQAPAAELTAHRLRSPPVIDGRLDDEAWAGPPLALGDWVSYNPLRGEPAPFHTDVWLAYDDRALYFAFRAHDPNPERIRATVARRDNLGGDDWVAVSLDSTGSGQVAYHMFVNPNGVQMDALNTGDSGEDMAPDWIWHSAGRVDAGGYTVEIQLPLQSIRFSGGSEVRMGLAFFRRHSRLGISWSWPEMAPGQWVFQSHVPLLLRDLQQPRLLEVIPSVTASRNRIRPAGRPWNEAITTGDAGISAKYGLTSTITVDATLNPDFSQVESDAFEIEVNQRFPVFFSEKRPFFMEGIGLFNVAGTGNDASMRTAVHTRRIVEPSAGAKLTGTAGRQTFALLATADRSDDGGASRKVTIGRAIRNGGHGQYAGVLVTSLDRALEHNRVAAVDFVRRHGERFRWNGAVFHTDSRSAEGERTHGAGAQASYAYHTRRLTILGQLEHYDRDFRMDTAFINRVGMTRGWQYQEVQFYPDAAGDGRLKRVAPFLWVTGARDRMQDGTERFVLPGIRFNFTRQGYLRLDVGRGHETFAGRRFRTGRAHADGGAQILRWLSVGGSLDHGPAVFYDPENPFQGTSHRRTLRIGLQPSARLSHHVSYSFAGFESATGEDIFAVHIINLRNTYQFDRRFFVRAIAQTDSSRRRILGDLLASFELVPGTVVHAGYGTLIEGAGGGPYAATARAFFFKASYLARF